MHSSSDENIAKRRKVRKGTHSCWECRRRKVKCTFKSPQDSICITCHRRGTKCASQRDFEDPDSSYHFIEYTGPTGPVDHCDNEPDSRNSRTSQLATGSNTGICTPSTYLSESPTPALAQHADSVQPIRNGRQSKQPQQLHRASNVASIVEPNTHARITQSLLRALPSQKDIKLLLGSVPKVPLLCYQSFIQDHHRYTQETADKRMSIPNLLFPEDHPVLLASQMLLFSVALQSLPPSDVPSGLSKSFLLIMEDLAESAIHMVTTNDALLGTLESLENIILEGMYHVNRGNIRRAWITMRRAVTTGQLLGVDLPCHFRFKLISNRRNLDPQTMWECIIWMERILSLLLGLPSSTLSITFIAQDEPSTTVEGLMLPSALTNLTAKILERNQIRDLQESLELTKRIDKELVSVAAKMPSKFWRPPAFADVEIDSPEALYETRRALEHIRYHTLVNQLYLPYMLCPGTSIESTCSKIACVNASREIMSRQIAIRTFNPTSGCHRMGDFLALIAGLTLVLSHIFSHCHKELDSALIHQRQSDRALVEQLLERMESMSELRDDVLAVKCGVLLKDLLAVEEEAAQGDRTQNLQLTSGDGDGDENGCQVLAIHVPYVGAVKIARKGNISITPFQKASRDQNAHESVTIGGIGSVHLNNSRLPSQSSNDGNLDNPVHLTASAHAAESTQPLASLDAQVMPGEIFVQQDQMFPDAAAPMDDWVFQGFDTAFFDVLMRGVTDQQLNDS